MMSMVIERGEGKNAGESYLVLGERREKVGPYRRIRKIARYGTVSCACQSIYTTLPLLTIGVTFVYTRTRTTGDKRCMNGCAFYTHGFCG